LFYWNELTTDDFATLSANEVVAILPIAATEQHGPHLPVATDSAIAHGMIATLRAMLPEELKVLVLPVQEVGKSDEHLAARGTLTGEARDLIALWRGLGAGVKRAGLAKLIIVNSHGGNNPVMDIVARDLRVNEGMLVAVTQWNRFGLPPGTYDETEKRFGVHAGAVETALMLHFRPDLVRMDRARDFRSAAEAMEDRYAHLRPTGPHAMGWTIGDINPHGAVGNAAAGDRDKGRAIAHHQVAAFIELVADVARFPLHDMFEGPVPAAGPAAGVS
jgi:creatinine amidohydrolase